MSFSETSFLNHVLFPLVKYYVIKWSNTTIVTPVTLGTHLCPMTCDPPHNLSYRNFIERWVICIIEQFVCDFQFYYCFTQIKNFQTEKGHEMKVTLVLQALSVASLSLIVCASDSRDRVERFLQVRNLQIVPAVLAKEMLWCPPCGVCFPENTTVLNYLPHIGIPSVHPRSCEPPRQLESH